MIENLRIRNFRCFKSVYVEDLRRINVVVGRNASGKSTLLESIWVASGSSPLIGMKVRNFRGLGLGSEISIDPVVFQTIWDDLFHQFDANKKIEINVESSSTDSRSLEIYYEEEPLTLKFNGEDDNKISGIGVDVSHVSVVNFKWKRANDQEFETKALLTGTGIDLDGKAPKSFPAIMFTPNFTESGTETAKRFSELSKQGNAEIISQTLRQEYPFIESLSTEIQNDKPQIFASVFGMKRKLPLSLVSSGISKLVSYLVAIVYFKKGTVLIDEIENGFYYDRLPSIWRIIYDFANQYETQIFATTHSQENLKAVAQITKGREKGFSLIRTTRKEGESDVSMFSGTQFEIAVEQGAEIR